MIKFAPIVSAGAAFVSLVVVTVISQFVLGQVSGLVLSASMGASAVLLFSAPHSPMSQPWPLVGGHIVSAAIGVTCAAHVDTLALAAPLAVSLSILAMGVLRCVHPPGGAAALIAVVGGRDVESLGYQFVVCPILVNAVIMLIAMYLINKIVLNRIYPNGSA